MLDKHWISSGSGELVQAYGFSRFDADQLGMSLGIRLLEDSK
jgi:hypothetical protein